MTFEIFKARVDIVDEKERQDDREQTQKDEQKDAKRRKIVLPTDPRLQGVAREAAEVEPDALEVVRPKRRKNDRRKMVRRRSPSDGGTFGPLDRPKCGARQSAFAPRPHQIHDGVDDAPSKIAAQHPDQHRPSHRPGLLRWRRATG